MCGCGKSSSGGTGTPGGQYRAPEVREPVVWRHHRSNGTYVDYLSSTEAYGARSAVGGSVEKVKAAR